MKRCLFSQAVSSVATVRLDLIKIRHGCCLELLFKVRLPSSSSWPLQVYNMACNVEQKLVKDLFMCGNVNVVTELTMKACGEEELYPACHAVPLRV